MALYDCFMYFDEEIVLDTRLNYLDQYVDYFVIIESCFTHRGDNRKLKFDINKVKKDRKLRYISGFTLSWMRMTMRKSVSFSWLTTTTMRKNVSY